MGLLEQAAKVKIIYQADTSQAKAEIKTLRGVEKKAAQERLAEIEKGNKQIKDQAEGWKNTADKIALVGGAIAVAKLGLDAYAKTGAENAAKVKKITDGVGGAINGLLSGIGSVVVAFGPMLTAAATFVSALAEAVRLMGELSQAATGSVWEIAAKEYKRRTGKDMPEMRTLTGHARHGLYGDAPSAFGDIGSGIGKAYGFMRGVGRPDAWGNTLGSDEIEMPEMDVRRKSGPAGKRGSNSTASDTDSLVALLEAEVLAERQAALHAELKGVADSFPSAAGLQMKDSPLDLEAMNLALEKLTQINALAKEAGQDSLLKTLFGDYEEFDLYQAGMEQIGSAFSTLTSGLQAGFGAWIDGSKSAGAAFKAVLAESLKASATEMLGEGIKHGAYALGSLAFQRWDKAAMHGKAAAAHFAGAAALGGMAKLAHNAGWAGSTGGGGAASPGAPRSGGGGSGESSPDRIIVVGDHFAEQTPRARAQTARNLVSRAYAAQEEW
jgi:hypothetical protein